MFLPGSSSYPPSRRQFTLAIVVLAVLVGMPVGLIAALAAPRGVDVPDAASMNDEVLRPSVDSTASFIRFQERGPSGRTWDFIVATPDHLRPKTLRQIEGRLLDAESSARRLHIRPAKTVELDSPLGSDSEVCVTPDAQGLVVRVPARKCFTDVSVSEASWEWPLIAGEAGQWLIAFTVTISYRHDSVPAGQEDPAGANDNDLEPASEGEPDPVSEDIVREVVVADSWWKPVIPDSEAIVTAVIAATMTSLVALVAPIIIRRRKSRDGDPQIEEPLRPDAS